MQKEQDRKINKETYILCNCKQEYVRKENVIFSHKKLVRTWTLALFSIHITPMFESRKQRSNRALLYVILYLMLMAF